MIRHPPRSIRPDLLFPYTTLSRSEVNSFATVGAGNLAPPKANPQVAAMVEETARLARGFSGQGWPILAFLDTHVPGKPEPPYPPHCEAGTGEEDLVPELTWLGDDPHEIGRAHV